jgi:hypothetical protein
MTKGNPMTTTHSLKLSVIVAGLLALASAHAADTMSKADYKAAKESVTAQYKTDKAACDSLKDNAKDVCIEEAKGKEKVAKAELEYKNSGKDKDRTKLAVAKAEANYAVAKEKCDDKAGNDKDVCRKEAKAAEVKAKADAKMNKKVTAAKKDAAEDKRDADYKVNIEKCDALSGDAKTNCVAQANKKYGKS